MWVVLIVPNYGQGKVRTHVLDRGGLAIFFHTEFILVTYVYHCSPQEGCFNEIHASAALVTAARLSSSRTANGRTAGSPHPLHPPYSQPKFTQAYPPGSPEHTQACLAIMSVAEQYVSRMGPLELSGAAWALGTLLGRNKSLHLFTQHGQHGTRPTSPGSPQTDGSSILSGHPLPHTPSHPPPIVSAFFSRARDLLPSMGSQTLASVALSLATLGGGHKGGASSRDAEEEVGVKGGRMENNGALLADLIRESLACIRGESRQLSGQQRDQEQGFTPQGLSNVLYCLAKQYSRRDPKGTVDDDTAGSLGRMEVAGFISHWMRAAEGKLHEFTPQVWIRGDMHMWVWMGHMYRLHCP